MRRKTIRVYFYLALCVTLVVVLLIGFSIYKESFTSANLVQNTTQKIVTETQNVVNKDPLSTVPSEFAEITILGMRQKQISAGEITIENMAFERSSYTAYVASYNSDGYKIYGLLTVPNSTEPAGGYPAVVFDHGYIPPSVYNTVTRYQDYVDYIARNGIVVFKIDFRGHDRSEGEPDGAYYSSGYVEDTLNAYESLKTLDYVNDNKIALWGHSMSGNVVLRSLAVKPEIPAAIIWAGAVYTYDDWGKYGIDDNSYEPSEVPAQRREKRQRLFETYGRVEEGNPFWNLVSPIDYLKGYNGKINIHHAVNDNVVSVEYARNLEKVLDEKYSGKIDITVYEYNSGGHNLVSPAFESAMQRTVELIKSL